MDTQKPMKYRIKLLDIQRALTLVDTDVTLIVTICKEMAFQWVPSILEHLDQLSKENAQLKAANLQLNRQNDSLLHQNIILSRRPNHQ